MSNKILTCAAVFAGVDGDAEVLQIPCGSGAARTFEEKLLFQYKDFSNLEAVAYHGEYKADSDECLSISGYQDADEAIASMHRLCNGQAEDAIEDLGDLIDCRGLLFSVPGIDDCYLIQRFTKSLLFRPGDGVYFWSGDVVKAVEEYQFAIGASLAGIYRIKENELRFGNVKTIRSVFPKFDETYAPGATLDDLEKFFSHPVFDEGAVERVKRSDSSNVARLVWLAMADKVDMGKEFPYIERWDRMLNMGCCENGKIRFPREVSKAKIVLRMALGDVTEKGGRVFLANSKKPLEKFD